MARSKKAPATNAGNGRTLVIVESPNKARTISGILGADFDVRASKGHVRDLPSRNKGAIDVDNGFKPKWVVDVDKAELVKELKGQVKAASTVVLATDLDREGETIAWHLGQLLGLDVKEANRVVFHEVTPVAIKKAFGDRRPLDMQMVEAGVARRVLDRLIGYGSSSVLQRMQKGLSGGRVQTVSLRLVVERDREIRAFVPVEYWGITADVSTTRREEDRFFAKLVSKGGKKIPDKSISTKADADALVAALQTAAYSIDTVGEKPTERKSPAPFITSTLQQAALNKLGMSAKRGMQVAQELYEGVKTPQGQIGLITYMRTDSITVAEPAQIAAKDFIIKQWGAEYAPAKFNVHKSKAAKTQEAHECIRPTDVTRTPDSLQSALTPEQFKLYSLVWKRFLASQMAPARFSVRTVTVKAVATDASVYGLRASATALTFPGWKAAWGITTDEAVFKEKAEDEKAGDDKDEEIDAGKIPADVVEGEACKLWGLKPEQHFTEPPAHYTEATLVKMMEELGIGRPSTYAPTIATILARSYVMLEGKALNATPLGEKVCDFLVEQFPDTFNTTFTAKMEEDLDEIAGGSKTSFTMLDSFWKPFAAKLGDAASAVVEKPMEPTGRDCPDCGKELVKRWGRFGPFIACPGYPECKYKDVKEKTPVISIGIMCPKCGKELVQRTSTRRTKADGAASIFWGCSGFPNCKGVLFGEQPTAQKCDVCEWLKVAREGEGAPICPKCHPKPRAAKKVALPVVEGDEPPPPPPPTE